MMEANTFAAVEGPSFPVTFKLLATLGMGGLAFMGWGARAQLMAMPLPPDLLWLAGLATAVVAWHYLHILFSTTAISSDTLSQGWLWRSSVPLRDIAQVKLLRFKPLDAVVAPRLVVSTRGLGNRTFHMADPAVLTVIEVLVHGAGPEKSAFSA
ncbi:MAG: hypothetical protein DCF26_13310 [Burkholderiales bacterium]|nr:MAG: hypothetical protein DCF26_13310 [Burkholderiales bacterium]